MTDGFRVDLGALRDASDGIRTTIDQTSTTRVKDIDGDHDAFGHHDLGGTFGDFCERWDIGVGHLTTDVSGLVLSLDACVTAYDNTDEGVRLGFDGYLVRDHGTDPGAG